jgi:hypothetical protein
MEYLKQMLVVYPSISVVILIIDNSKVPLPNELVFIPNHDLLADLADMTRRKGRGVVLDSTSRREAKR